MRYQCVMPIALMQKTEIVKLIFIAGQAMTEKGMRLKSDLKRRFAIYDDEHARQTLDSRVMTPYYRQAQWAEFAKLKEIIGRTYALFNRPLSFLDIGVGYARIPLWLSQVPTWDKVGEYIGIDISDFCVTQSKRIVAAKGMKDRVEIIKFDALDLANGVGSADTFKKNDFDLAICTYFTGGDFKPDEIELKTGNNGLIADYDRRALKPNKNFIRVFRGAYGLLRDGGKIVIGSLYYDSDLAKKIQEDFYRRCTMRVITSNEDLFTATLEGFWSERFNENRIHEYLLWASPNKIEIIPLDDYNFAMMVTITK